MSAPQIEITPLGAGQDVGRSCILASIGSKTVMFDCGFESLLAHIDVTRRMHMGYDDARRFPDFSFISRSGDFTRQIDAVIISHFHLDHVGALPYFTEMCGYDGPIYMTAPTKVRQNAHFKRQKIVEYQLEDYRKISVERKGEKDFFTSDDIRQCMKKVITVGLNQTIRIDDDLEIKAYYAGHVLGAAMFLVRSGNLSVLYTGDYNTTADGHLGPARIDRCRPDVVITETTYATTVRDSRKAREADFLRKVHRQPKLFDDVGS
jgi:integrator complex subunit 11